MTGTKSLVVLFVHTLFGQRQLHGKQGNYVQFFNLGGQQMLVRKIDLENMFLVDAWPLFFTNCSTAFCLFGQGSAEHR